MFGRLLDWHRERVCVWYEEETSGGGVVAVFVLLGNGQTTEVEGGSEIRGTERFTTTSEAKDDRQGQTREP